MAILGGGADAFSNVDGLKRSSRPCSCAIPRSFEDGAENRLEGRAAMIAAARESVDEDTGKSRHA
jgi:hypothetical protein